MVRHRLSLAGNRKLNRAPCTWSPPARPGRTPEVEPTTYRKKMAEGKSRKEALRCLKRRISDAVFRSLMADSQVPLRGVA